MESLRKALFGKGTSDVYSALAKADKQRAADEDNALGIEYRVIAAEAAEDRARAKARRKAAAEAELLSFNRTRTNDIYNPTYRNTYTSANSERYKFKDKYQAAREAIQETARKAKQTRKNEIRREMARWATKLPIYKSVSRQDPRYFNTLRSERNSNEREKAINEQQLAVLRDSPKALFMVINNQQLDIKLLTQILTEHPDWIEERYEDTIGIFERGRRVGKEINNTPLLQLIHNIVDNPTFYKKPGFLSVSTDLPLQVVKLLIERGAKIHAMDVNGMNIVQLLMNALSKKEGDTKRITSIYTYINGSPEVKRIIKLSKPDASHEYQNPMFSNPAAGMYPRRDPEGSGSAGGKRTRRRRTHRRKTHKRRRSNK